MTVADSDVILTHPVGVRRYAPRLDTRAPLDVKCPVVYQGNTAVVHSCAENTMSRYVVVTTQARGDLLLTEVEVYQCMYQRSRCNRVCIRGRGVTVYVSVVVVYP